MYYLEHLEERKIGTCWGQCEDSPVPPLPQP